VHRGVESGQELRAVDAVHDAVVAGEDGLDHRGESALTLALPTASVIAVPGNRTAVNQSTA
jgi:hypothetical protein